MSMQRWWGPPTYPATVLEHDLSAGGTVSYYMTSPEGDRSYGWWRVSAVEAPYRLEFVDGFGDDKGNPVPDMPTSTVRVTLSADATDGTVMEVVSTFPTTEAMEQLLAMGMDEGIRAAAGQLDEVLTAQHA